MKAYLVLITWPDGKEGLLFPRPGNVQVAATHDQGRADYEKALSDLLEYAGNGKRLSGTTIRLVEFERGPTLDSFVL